MANRTKGIVSKTGKGKYSYYIRLDGDSVYYNTKFEPKCNEGDTVGIEFEPKGETRANIKNIKIFERGSGAPPKQFGGGSAPAASGGDRQDSIICQHSQEMAISYLAVLLEQGAVKVTGNPEAKRTQLDATLGELTVRFFKEAEKPRDSSAFKTERELEKDLGEDEPEEDGWDDDAKDEDPWGEWEN